MKHGSELSIEFKDLIVVHQNLPKRVVTAHSHKLHEIILPLAGTTKVTTDGSKTLQARRGEMILIPASMSHSYEVGGSDAEQIVLLFNPKWLDSEIDSAKVLQHSVLIAELCIFLITTQVPLKFATSSDETQGSIVETLRLAVRRSLEAANAFVPLNEVRARIKDERLRKAISYLETHFADENAITDSASAAAASARTLSRLYKDEIGTSAGDILRTIRVSHAKKLLTAGNYSVTEVALESGYSSMSQFISVFKTATGSLPSQFKKK